MASCAQFAKKRPPAATEIEPQLREFIDHAIVPALVRQYLRELDAQRRLADTDGDMAQSVKSTATIPLKGAR